MSPPPPTLSNIYCSNNFAMLSINNKGKAEFEIVLHRWRCIYLGKSSFLQFQSYMRWMKNVQLNLYFIHSLICSFFDMYRDKHRFFKRNCLCCYIMCWILFPWVTRIANKQCYFLFWTNPLQLTIWENQVFGIGVC